MTKSAPAHSHSKYLSLAQLTSKFSSVDEAERWFVNRRWPKGVRCVRCDSDNMQVRPTRKPQPFRCRDCRKDFSFKTDTVLHNSKIPLPSWTLAFYLFSTNLKSVSSMKLRRDQGITQKSAWNMGHLTREDWGTDVDKFDGPVEVDEAYTDGKEGNKHECKTQNAGRSPVGKAAVVGIKDRETNRIAVMLVESTDTATLQGFAHERTNHDTMVFVDEARAYDGLRRPHDRVKEFVNGMIHTKGLELHWAILKHANLGAFHHESPKHLGRYTNEFAGRHNALQMDTEDQMTALVQDSIRNGSI